MNAANLLKVTFKRKSLAFEIKTYSEYGSKRTNHGIKIIRVKKYLDDHNIEVRHSGWLSNKLFTEQGQALYAQSQRSHYF